MIAVLALLAVQSATVVPPFDAAAKTIVQDAIKDRLLDGESARWRWWPFIAGATSEATYCGFYNAKNRMGGYSGFNPVWVTGHWEPGAFIPTGVNFALGPHLTGLAAQNCMKAGYQMDRIPSP